MAYLGSAATGFVGGMDAGHRWQDRSRKQEEDDFMMMEKRLNMAGDHLSALFTDPETGMQLDPSQITQGHADRVASIINRFGIASSFFQINKNVSKKNPIAKMRIMPGQDPKNPNAKGVVFELNMRDGSVQPMTWGRSSDQSDQVAMPSIEDVAQMLMVETNPQYVMKDAMRRAKAGAGGQRRSGGGGRGRRRSGGGGGERMPPAPEQTDYGPFSGILGEEEGEAGPEMAGGMQQTAMGITSPIGGQKEGAARKKKIDRRPLFSGRSITAQQANDYIAQYGREAWREKKYGTGKGKDTSTNKKGDPKTEKDPITESDTLKEYGYFDDEGKAHITMRKEYDEDTETWTRSSVGGKNKRYGNSLDDDSDGMWEGSEGPLMDVMNKAGNPENVYLDAVDKEIDRREFDQRSRESGLGGINQQQQAIPDRNEPMERETTPDDFSSLDAESALKPSAADVQNKTAAQRKRPWTKKDKQGNKLYRQEDGKYLRSKPKTKMSVTTGQKLYLQSDGKYTAKKPKARPIEKEDPGIEKYRGKVFMIDGRRFTAAQIRATAKKNNTTMDRVLHSLRYARKKKSN